MDARAAPNPNSLADRYRALRRAKNPRLPLKRRVTNGAKTVLYLFGEIPEKGLSLRQITLLKLIGVVWLCAFFHYIGFASARSLSEWEFSKQIEQIETQAELKCDTAAKAWFQSTIGSYEDCAYLAADDWFPESIWSIQSERTTTSALVSCDEYRYVLRDMRIKELIDEDTYHRHFDRTRWAELKSPLQAWKEFSESPRSNLLPLFWYSRANPRFVPFLIRDRLVLEGADFNRALAFLIWFLPYMDEFDRQAFLRACVIIRFNPSALQRLDSERVVALVSPSPGFERLHTYLTFDIDPAESRIEVNDFTHYPLEPVKEHGVLNAHAPEHFRRHGDITIRVGLAIEYRELRGDLPVNFREKAQFVHTVPRDAALPGYEPAYDITRLENLPKTLQE